MAKGQVGEREAELMLKWRKQGLSLNEIMTLARRTKVTALNHIDPEKKPRNGPGRPKCIGSKGVGFGLCCTGLFWAVLGWTGLG